MPCRFQLIHSIFIFSQFSKRRKKNSLYFSYRKINAHALYPQ
ncbi:hypothetical protein DB43_AS00440 [Parachlamydia acanthamoebae]|uniref:Uncharacterized protein n=1 Tax=Parachlamydia acanthamoebae TaxID=83552 RepID=A0A0C1EHS2_9BACT|nr:hypothetical protein DB43_AS00440 [Parachlamydia acanthamoebae]